MADAESLWAASSKKFLPEQKLLAEDSAFSEDDTPEIYSKPRRRSYAKVLAFTFGIVLMIILVGKFTWPLLHVKEGIQWLSCGNSSAEARENGCHYEPMQRSWIPDACYFSEPGEEYHPFEDREWFENEHLTTRLNATRMESLRNGDDMTAYTRSFHDEHCLYAWRKLSIAVERRMPMIDSKSLSYHHSQHCAVSIGNLIYNVAAGNWNAHEYSTLSPTMFQTCIPLDWS